MSTGSHQTRHETRQLEKLHAVKQFKRPPIDPIGPAMVDFFKQSVQKRQTRLTKIAEAWGRLVPELLTDHCAI